MRSKPKSSKLRDEKIGRRKEKRELKRNPVDFSVPNEVHTTYVAKKEIAPLRALNEAQGQYIASIIANTITFSVGPAGTGKSYVAGAWAAEQLKQGLIEKIIITRPCTEVGYKFGAMPGEMEEKYAPFLEPFKDVLIERLGRTFYDYAIKTGKIVPSPLQFMRGKTFDDAVVILDEAQNVDREQMKMFLTRIGRNSKLIIDGSLTQIDIHNSGLEDALFRLKKIPSIGVVEFTIDDIVRNGIIKDILIAYENTK